MAEQKVVICPYCGDTQPLAERCRACSGLFEPLSRQATHNAMGPWFVRDADRPFQPGCSYETLLRLIERGRVTKFSIVRGPTTRQFWTIAKHVPGLSHLLGYCHQCDASVDGGDHSCHACGASFAAYVDRNYLGLPEVRPLPWEAQGQQQIRQPVRNQGQIWRQAIDGNEPRTISSFASDDELLGRGEHAGNPLPPSFGGGATAVQKQTDVATLPQENFSDQPEPVSSVQPVQMEKPAGNRSLAQQQRRTIRILLVSTVALAMLVIAFSFGWFQAIFAPPKESTPSQTQPTTAVSQDAESTATQPQLQTNGHALYELLTGHERAIGLMSAAADEQRPLGERIDDLEQALKLLTAVKAEAEPALWPANLQEQMDEAREQLDRLRLREFFP